MEGTQAPNICPVCSKEQGYFIRLNMTPWTCQNECKVKKAVRKINANSFFNIHMNFRR